MALVVIGAAATSSAQDVVDGFAARSFESSRGVRVPYRLFVPDAAARAQALPLIVYLHGSGGIGSDNRKQFCCGNESGTHVWTSANAQRAHPAFVLAPQLPVGEEWASESASLSPYGAIVLEIIAALSREFAIDEDRVYLTGQSLGGYGTWDIVSKRPDVFAAAVPLCGGGNVPRVAAARHVAIWAFHGAKDDAVPVEESRKLVAALRAAGSPVKYTEYSGIGHDVWTRAYHEPGLANWLFNQRRQLR